MKSFFCCILIAVAISCNSGDKQPGAYKTTGSIEVLSPSLSAIVDSNARLEIIAEGFDWTEGPLWLEKEQALLFSDIPPNSVFKWTENEGVTLYLKPSGYTGTAPRTGEVGSNGIILNPQGQLVLCQHGDRRLAVMNAPLDKPESKFTTIADVYDGKKFNSPNDAVYRSNGDLFFTDPPYGLEKYVDDPAKEIPFQGVYITKPSGEVKLLTDTITRPNGIGLLNNGNTLIVANSDGDKAIWYLFDIAANDSLFNGRILYDATAESKKDGGVPDGLKVDKSGNIFATGPGGVWIFDSKGTLAGKISVTGPCSNVSLGNDDKTLYITNDGQILRMKMRP